MAENENVVNEPVEEKKNKAEQEFEELIKAKLQEQFNRGIRVGVMTVSQVVLDKLSDSSKPFMKRVDDVKKFCKVPFKGMAEINERNKAEEAAKQEVTDETVTEEISEEN